jgi:C4-dicarboxylate-specific signal transduction histidine kinase
MDSDFLWHTLGGGAIITAALTLARLLLDYGMRGGERRLDVDERRRAQQRDAQARLERVLQDRLAEADRRLERSDAELRDERVRSAALEHELVCLRQAYDLLRVEYASVLQAGETHRLPR